MWEIGSGVEVVVYALSVLKESKLYKLEDSRWQLEFGRGGSNTVVGKNLDEVADSLSSLFTREDRK